MPVSSWVNSVEFIDAVISGSNNSATYNLSKGQNYANCIPFYTVCSNSSYFDNRLTDVYFSGTTQSGIINFSRAANRSTSNYVKCYIVEFNPEQVRVQQGTFTLTGTTAQTVTLPTTLSGTDRAAMTFGWQSNDTAQYTSRVAVRGRVVSTTSIDFYRYSSTSTCTGHWFLFEDKGDNFKTYHVSSSYTSTGQTLDISGQKTVDPLRTFVLGSHASSQASGGGANYWSTRIFIYSTGTVRSDRASSGVGIIYWSAQIIEILDQDKVYTPIDHWVVSWTSSTTLNRNTGGALGRVPFTCNTSTSSVATSMMQGFTRGDFNTTTGMIDSMATSELTASGTITHTKFGTSNITYPSYTVAVDWAGISVDTGSNPSPISKGNGPGQSFVKSVENFRFTLDGSIGVYVLTKGQVTSNCAVFSSNRSVSSNLISTICVNVYLKEPGLVYMQHWSDTEQAIVDVSVVEFYPDQVKVQQFNINNLSATTVNVPIEEISSVNKAFILSSVFTPYGGGISGFKYSFYRISFTSTTNVELYKNSSGYETVCSFFVVEDLQDNFVTEHCNQNFNIADNNFFSGNNYGVHNSFPIITYTTNSDDYPSRGAIRGLYAAEFRPLYCRKIDSSYYNIYWVGTIVKFIDNKRHTKKINVEFSGATSEKIEYYPLEIRGTENITAYNPVQYSTIACDGTSSSVTSTAFGTITITDYNVGSYTVSRGSGSSYSILGAHIINWSGYHYQSANNVTGTQTRSFINSIQKDFFETDGSFMQVWLRYNQDISKCVPFMVNSGAAIDYPFVRLHKTVYRYDDPDCFRLKFGANSSSNRKILTYIIEFNQNIKVQYGSGYSVGTSKTFTIEEVDLNRAFLQFYSYGDSWSTQGKYNTICGYFSSSTQLTFVRNATTGSADGMYISWYVVECPDWGTDSYWYVSHSTNGDLGTGGTVYNWFTIQPAIGRTIFLSSYASNGDEYTSRCIYRIFNRQDHGIQMDKSDTGYWNMVASNTECIEFPISYFKKGFKVYSNFYTLATTNLDVDLKLNSEDNFHIQRSMVLHAHNMGMTRTDIGSSTVGLQECCHYMNFKDTTGSGYSNTISISKTAASYTSYGFYYAIQFPKFNKYYFSGYVTEQGDAVSRKVAAYKYSTGELVDVDMSISGTGYFYLETPDYEPHYVVALDDDGGFSYNDLIYGKIYPTVISGAFGWLADSSTLSGISESM